MLLPASEAPLLRMQNKKWLLPCAGGRRCGGRYLECQSITLPVMPCLYFSLATIRTGPAAKRLTLEARVAVLHLVICGVVQGRPGMCGSVRGKRETVCDRLSVESVTDSAGPTCCLGLSVPDDNAIVVLLLLLLLCKGFCVNCLYFSSF